MGIPKPLDGIADLEDQLSVVPPWNIGHCLWHMDPIDFSHSLTRWFSGLIEPWQITDWYESLVIGPHASRRIFDVTLDLQLIEPLFRREFSIERHALAFDCRKVSRGQ
jgi:hypothetical protein